MGKSSLLTNPFAKTAQDFITLLSNDLTVGPFTDAIDNSIQIHIQTEFLSFIFNGQDSPPKDIKTEFAKLGFDYSDFDVILGIYKQAFIGMPISESERCLKLIEEHKSVFLGQNVDKSFGLSIIGGVKKLEMIAAICIAEARQFEEFASIFNMDSNHEHYLSKFFAYTLEVPKLTPKMRKNLWNLKITLGFSDLHTTGLLRILHDVIKQLNIDPHYGSLIEDRIANYKRELSDFETYLVEEVVPHEEISFKDKYLIESIGGETLMPEIVADFYSIIRGNPKIGYLFYTNYEKSQYRAQSVFLLCAISSTPLTPFIKYSMSYFHSRYPLDAADYAMVQEAYASAFRKHKIQEVLIEMCLDKIDHLKTFYMTEIPVKTSEKSIYKDLGGFKTVQKITQMIMDRVKKEAELVESLCVSFSIKHFTYFLCALLDNPNMSPFAKKRLRETHNSINVQGATFNRYKDIINSVLEELQIDPIIIGVFLKKIELCRQVVMHQGDISDLTGELNTFRLSVNIEKQSFSPPTSYNGEEKQPKQRKFLALLSRTPSFNRKQIDIQPEAKSNMSNLSEPSRNSKCEKAQIKGRSRGSSVSESILGMFRKVSNTSSDGPILSSKASDLSDCSDKSKNSLSPPPSNTALPGSSQNVISPSSLSTIISHTNSVNRSSVVANKRVSKYRSSTVSQARPIAEDISSPAETSNSSDDDRQYFGKSSGRKKDSLQKRVLKPELPHLPKRNIYELLGGEDGIFEMVEQWGELLQKDRLLGPYFVKSNMIKIKATQKRITTLLLTLEQIPEKDSKLISAAHSKLNLTNNHFDQMSALFEKAFVETGVSVELAHEAVGYFEKSRTLIVKASSRPFSWVE